MAFVTAPALPAAVGVGVLVPISLVQECFAADGAREAIGAEARVLVVVEAAHVEEEIPFH